MMAPIRIQNSIEHSNKKKKVTKIYKNENELFKRKKRSIKVIHIK